MTASLVVPLGGGVAGGTAPMSFTSGNVGGQVDADLVVEWDVDNDGEFEQGVEDVTEFVYSVETQAGRDFPSNLTGEASPGALRLALDNRDDRFSYFNTSSPLTTGGNSLRTGRKIRVRAAVGSALDCPGVAGSGASTPDHASLDITGDIDIRWEVTPDDATPAADGRPVQKSVTDNSWVVEHNTDGSISLHWSTTGASLNNTSTSASAAVEVGRKFYRVTMDVDNGAAQKVVTFYKGDTVDGPWTTITTNTTAGTTSIFSSAADLWIGRSGALPFSGLVHRVQVRDGIGGTIVADINFGPQTPGVTSITDDVGKVWTVDGTAVITIDTSQPNDPVLLAYDRFERNVSALGSDIIEFFRGGGSEPWDNLFVTNGETFSVHDGRAYADRGFPGDGNTFNASVDVDTINMYTQIRCSRPMGNNWLGVVGRAEPQVSNDWIYAKLFTDSVELREVIAGVDSLHATYSFIPWDGMALGLNVQGQTADVYVDGVMVLSHAVTGSSASNQYTGILALWDQFLNDPPSIEEFYVWTDVPAEIEGVLWTGDVSDVKTGVEVGDVKVAEVEGEGWLARAALAQVTSPVVPGGTTTGKLVGDVLARALLLHPPGIIDDGAVTTGAIALEDGDALELARQFEDTEVGFLHEMNEGPIGFRDRNDRELGPVLAWFSDTPGVGQFPFSGIDPIDSKRDVINRVTAAVAPDQPSGITITTRTAQTNAGVANHVDVLMPTTVNAGDLLVVIIASTVASSGVNWHNPIWWGRLREFAGEDDDSIRTRVYSKPADGTEGGTTVRFYTNTGTLGGAWVAQIFRIENWFENDTSGIAVSDFKDGANPPGIEPGWGRAPTLFIPVNAGLTSVGGGALTNQQAPKGYGPTLNSQFVNHATNGFDVALQVAWKIDSAEREDPTEYTGLSGFEINESFTLAVRGFNGPFTKPTLKQRIAGIEPVGGSGRFVTVEDKDSQADHNVIRSHATPSGLLASELDAEDYGERIVARYADDRPIVAIRFFPTTNAQLRTQAILRRVGEKIHLTANGDTGLGIEDDFVIESINHKITNGGKLWETTWELAPV